MALLRNSTSQKSPLAQNYRVKETNQRSFGSNFVLLLKVTLSRRRFHQLQDRTFIIFTKRIKLLIYITNKILKIKINKSQSQKTDKYKVFIRNFILLHLFP